MRIKVCGMREAENITALTGLNIHFMGFIFYEKSPRNFEPTQEIPSFKYIEKVGVFVNAELELVIEICKQKKLDYVQLHGSENIFYCQQLRNEGIKIIKAFSVDENFNFRITHAYKYFVDYFLFDTKGRNPGGNGVAFNWKLLENYDVDLPFFLSGGISEEDGKTIRDLNLKNLFAVDLNSKFEIKPAIKNVEKIKNFIHDLYH